MKELENKVDKRKTTFGLNGSYFHRVWANMKSRCLNSKNPAYKYYGGRGITICNRWLDFPNFIEDMYELYEYHIEHFGSGRKNCHLDRIDNNGDYSKDNCRWVTAKVNQNNRREYERGSAILVTYKGKTQNITNWAKHLGVNYYALKYRLQIAKWPVEKAFETPFKTCGQLALLFSLDLLY